MANNEILTDEYVASLLAKDAKESSIKYSALGLEGFATSKPPANKPKPNTRFLRNIIKDTDSHNAALLAKEAAESRARLESLPAGERRVEKATRIGGSDIRRRQLGDIASILGGRPIKRRKTEAPRIGKGGRRVNTSSEDEEPEEEPRVERKRKHDSREDKEEGRESRSHRSHHPRHRSASEDRGEDKEDRKKRHRSRSRSPKDGRSKDSRRRHRSPRRKRSRSPEEEKSREKSHRSHRCRRSPSKARRESKKESRVVKEPEPRPDDDSDPLDEIIGPRPPPVPEVRSRGRGTMSHASGIDSRFSANYDPTVDVQLDPDEENDWDQALEALRDRQKWKQQGADRLRSAGFTDEEIKKWEKGGEKSVEDVTWAKKGEGREWDRGKVFDDEGGVKIDPEFGRLKDT